MTNSGKSRKAKRLACQPDASTELTEAALPTQTVEPPVEQPPVVAGELVGQSDGTFSGKGASIRLLARGLREGWDIAAHTRADAIAAIHETLASRTLSARDRSALTKVLVSIDRLKIESEKLDCYAEINGLHAVPVAQVVDHGETARSYVRRLLDACTTLEELDAFVALTNRAGNKPS